ncbi:MAG: YfhO family protein [Candidatus Marinimicrobia bacterium]|nr:YfhO family protein [Candidatus Neomarinimicrobiota bacterium]
MICILFYQFIFQGQVVGSPDTMNPKSAGVALQQVYLERGEFPLWEPWSFSGMPTAEAFTFISHLYFPATILNLLFIKGILAQLLHLLFAGIGGYILLRSLNLSYYSSILGGCAFMITPFMVTMIIFGHGSQMMTAAYIPWIMCLTIRVLQRPILFNVGLLAIFMGLQLQRAHVQIAYYTWMLAGSYVLFTLVSTYKVPEERNTSIYGFGGFAIAALLGIGIALVIYLPSLEYTPFSIRGGGVSGGADYNYATSWSFSPKELLTFIIPSAMGFGGQTYWGNMPFTDYPNYMGIVILVLAAIGFVHRRDPLMWFLLGTSILAIFISFGKNLSIIYDLFYSFFPFFNKFRIPAMILILVQFNISVMAAIGLNYLLTLHKQVIPRWFWTCSGVLVSFLLILTLGQSFLQQFVSSGFTPPRTQDLRAIQAINALRWDIWLKDAWIMVLILAAFFWLIWAFINQKIAKNGFAIAVTLLALTDIAIVDRKIIQPDKQSGRASQLISSSIIDKYFQHDQITKIMTDDSEKLFRIYPAGSLFSETRFRAFGLESVGGYHPAKLKIYNDFLQSTNNAGTLPLMRMLNVKYLISPQPINFPGLIQIRQGKMKTGRGNLPVTLYELDDFQPRAWFVENVEVHTGKNLPWGTFTAQSFDPGRTAFISQTDIGSNRSFTLGSVTDIQYSLHELTVKTKSTAEGFLVISEVYYPLRWKAKIDGKEVKYFETNGVIRGLIIPPGSHEVKFIYDRSSFRKGITISTVVFLLCIGIIAFGWVKSPAL